ncbi:hypothetical protein BDV18DRAFT_164507 [Aspergillus unguis]
MKVILTGATGFIGKEVLHQALENEAISSIIVLSRKPLAETISSHPKVVVRVIGDFINYPESLLRDLAGAEACFWCLGLAYSNDLEIYRTVNVEYTMAAVKAFTANLAGYITKPFKFLYCSGFVAERDQEKPLWVMPSARRIRGQVENELLQHGMEHPGEVDVWILRPAAVLPKEGILQMLIAGFGPSIRVDGLAGAFVDIGVNGSDGERILENGMLKRWAK